MKALILGYTVSVIAKLSSCAVLCAFNQPCWVVGTEMVNSLPHVKIELELSLLSSGYSLLGLGVD